MEITDLMPYRHYFDQFDLTEEQKLELVNAWWTIINDIYDHHIYGKPTIFGKSDNSTKVIL